MSRSKRMRMESIDHINIQPLIFPPNLPSVEVSETDIDLTTYTRGQHRLVNHISNVSNFDDFTTLMDTIDDRLIHTILNQACINRQVDRMKYICQKYNVYPEVHCVELALTNPGMAFSSNAYEFIICFMKSLYDPADDDKKEDEEKAPIKLILQMLCLFLSFDWNQNIYPKILLKFNKFIDFNYHKSLLSMFIKSPETCAFIVENFGYKLMYVQNELFIKFILLRRKHFLAKIYNWRNRVKKSLLI